jgi:hypothetical protein
MTGCTSRYLIDSIANGQVPQILWTSNNKRALTLIFGKSAFGISFLEKFISDFSYFACNFQGDLWVLDVLILVIGKVFIGIAIGWLRSRCEARIIG